MAYKHNKELMLKALKKAKGNKTAAARALKCDRKTIDYHISKDPEIAEAFTSTLAARLDKAEDYLYKLAFGKNTDDKTRLRALEFILSKQGRSRGYGNEAPTQAAPTKHEHTLTVVPAPTEGKG